MWYCFAHLKMLLALRLAAVSRHHPWNKHGVSTTLSSTACDGTSSTALNTVCPDIPACFFLSRFILARIFVQVRLFGPSDGLVVLTPAAVIFDCGEAPEPLDCCADSTGILVCSIVSPDPLATAFGLVYPEDRLKFDSASCDCRQFESLKFKIYTLSTWYVSVSMLRFRSVYSSMGSC
jgi:hypothetical protein